MNDFDIAVPTTPTQRPRPVAFDLRMRTLKASRTTLARVIREYANGGIPGDVYKGLIFGFSTYLAFLRSEKDAEIEARLDALESRQK